MSTSTTLLLYAIPFAIAGIAGKHAVQRRRFYRRNQAGVEEFRNYGAMVATRTLEALLAVASGLCRVAAFVLVCGFGFARCMESQDLGSKASSAPTRSNDFSFARPSRAAKTVTGSATEDGSGSSVRDHTAARKRPEAVGASH
jgi:hypothetical protein